MLGIDNWVQLSNEDDQNRSPKSEVHIFRLTTRTRVN